MPGAGGRGKWEDAVQQIQIFNYVRQVSSRDLLYNNVSIVNNLVSCI